MIWGLLEGDGNSVYRSPKRWPAEEKIIANTSELQIRFFLGFPRRLLELRRGLREFRNP